jgi:hypothetical protein
MISLPDCNFAELDFDRKKEAARLLVKRVDVAPDSVKVIFK